MLAFIFYFFLCYLLYKLVFNFIIPVYRTTRQVRKSFKEMNEHMQGNTAGYQQTQSNPEDKKPNTDNIGEYIDFEEVP